MVREIVRDPIILKVRSSAADENDMQTARDLMDTLKANSDRCVGMAANMIGIHKTILAAHLGKNFVIMINPVITAKEKEYETEEGCLSLDGVRPAKRWSVITVEYLDENMRKKKKVLRGFDAQIIQHEMDHFSGIII
ncbi:MAG: peptide deformylase [Huintestinicola sp.]